MPSLWLLLCILCNMYQKNVVFEVKVEVLLFAIIKHDKVKLTIGILDCYDLICAS